MPGSTNFVQVNPTAANQESDSAYVADSLVTGGIVVDALLPSPYLNKKDYQITTMLYSLALALVGKNFSPNDGSANPSTAVANLTAVLANILTTADYPAIISAIAAGADFSVAGTTWHLKLPSWLGSLIIQGFLTGPYNAEGQYSIIYPLAFPTACLGVYPATVIAAATNAADAMFQVIGSPARTTCTIYLQAFSNTAFATVFNCSVLAIGY